MHNEHESRLGGRVLGVFLALTLAVGLAPATAGSAADLAVLVGFHVAPGPEQVALVESVGGIVTHQYKYIPVLAAVVPADQVEVLEETSDVAYVEEDHELVLFAGKQVLDWGVERVEAPAAWELGHRGKGVRVGIFDTGIDVDHPDLSGSIAGGVDLIGDGNGIDDCHGHGTHVAGIVGARDNGHGTAGVAPQVELYAMRFFNCAGGGATQSRELQGIEWAIDNDMQVINMSFGCCSIQGVFVPVPSQAEEAAMNAAYERGIVLVAASGNASEPQVAFPAGYDSVIAVGATDDRDNLATFSSYGEDQELTAPGVLNFSSVPVGTGQRTELTVDTDGDRELSPVPMQFAGMTKKKGITAETVYAGLGTDAEFASVDCTGRTAVISRGGTTFAAKTQSAMDAGCVAAIIHNNLPGNFNGTLGSEGDWIPVVSISLSEGLYLKDQIEAGLTVTTLVNTVGDHDLKSGTSMASPHAAGVAALVRGKNPALTPDEVRAILRASVDDLGLPGWDPIFGYGRVNARKAVEN